jgi:hypothetical protein
MGVEELDEMAAPGVIDTLFQEAKRFESRGYADNGCALLEKHMNSVKFFF